MTVQELKEKMIDLGFSQMASQLVHDDAFLSLTVWSNDDVGRALMENKVVANEKNIQTAIDYLNIDPLEDCSGGNEYLDEEIRELKSEGAFK